VNTTGRKNGTKHVNLLIAESFGPLQRITTTFRPVSSTASGIRVASRRAWSQALSAATRRPRGRQPSDPTTANLELTVKILNKSCFEYGALLRYSYRNRVTLGGDLIQKRCSASVSLTARQLEVLQLAVDGLSAKEMAQELSISVRTAEGHLAALRSLAGVGTLHGLTAWAVASGAAWPSWLSLRGMREAVARESLGAGYVGDAGSAGWVHGVMAGSGCGGADNAEYFRFAEVWASYTYGNSPRSGKPPH
jgi:DNA-binding CsgD family transcriptional regulator